MKKTKRWIFLGLVVIMSMFTQLMAYAASYNTTESDMYVKYFEKEDGVLTIGQPKGSVISTIFINTSDAGGGKMKVTAEMQCHVALSEASMSLSVEDDNGSIGSPREYEWVKADYPNNDLSYTAISFTVSVPKRGEYYHVYGEFSATDMYGNTESKEITSRDLYIE